MVRTPCASGCFKLITDGAWAKDDRKGVQWGLLLGILMDCLWLVNLSNPFSDIACPLAAELLAIRDGIIFAIDCGLRLQ